MVLPSISEALFQSTLPSRGVTPAGSRKNDKQRISTHAPLLWNNWKLNFNPRSPRGERRQGFIIHCLNSDFNPRSPRGERLGAF